MVPAADEHYCAIDFIAAANLLVNPRHRVPVVLRTPMPWIDGRLPDSLVVSATSASGELAFRKLKQTEFKLEICGIKFTARRCGPLVGSWLYVEAAPVFGALSNAIAKAAMAEAKSLAAMGVTIGPTYDDHRRPRATRDA
jgi:hypothetical protein